MFNHEQLICAIGLPSKITNIISEIAPKNIMIKHYESLVNADVLHADYIIAKLDTDDILLLFNILEKLNKNTDDLILCVNNDEFYDLKIENVGDIWPYNPSENDIKFYFKKLTKRINLENRLYEQKEIFNTIINSTDDLVWVKDTVGSHKFFNDSFLAALPPTKDGRKKTREECTERGHLFLWELSPREYQEGEFVCMESELEVMRSDTTLTFDEILKVGNGELRNLITKKSPIHDRHGKIMGTIGIAKDVTNELRCKQLEKIAYTDVLTGLYNRCYIFDWMENHSNKEFVVLFMDLNNFKFINDRYGHVIGDEALVITADTLNKILNEHNFTLGRIGGDEFMAVGYRESDLEHISDTIRFGMDKAYQSNEIFKTLSVSVGYAKNDPKNPDTKN